MMMMMRLFSLNCYMIVESSEMVLMFMVSAFPNESGIVVLYDIINFLVG